MLEGLWVVRFVVPNGTEGDLNGGVIVIETTRILGGDSGYFYIGEVGAPNHDRWPISLKIHRHDPSIESVFGDADDFSMTGYLDRQSDDSSGRPTLLAIATESLSGSQLQVRLTRVAELP